MMSFMNTYSLKHILARRECLRKVTISNSEHFSESCVPSYRHPNFLASLVAWSRLFSALRMFKKYMAGNNVLDFGAGSGELAILLDDKFDYDFIEEVDELSNYVSFSTPLAKRVYVHALKANKYDAIFCLDSLEHNSDYESLIVVLLSSLKPGGVLILSGPTENFLYRLGRFLSGFSGGYHKTNIFSIECCLNTKLEQINRLYVPMRIPLFSISAWRKS
jgi:2-polyprenyl-3-methyl-5-hydroxy-6-metoxy-1,4-benzoquinol methylase